MRPAGALDMVEMDHCIRAMKRGLSSSTQRATSGAHWQQAKRFSASSTLVTVVALLIGHCGQQRKT